MYQRTTSIKDSGRSLQCDDIHVLHVDDDPSFGDLVSTFLKRESDRFEVHTETSGQDGLNRLGDDESQFDCIVSDYDMPRMNGIEFLRAVRSEYPDLPFILFTGKGCEAVARDALRAGATDYIQKQGATDNYGVLANRIQNVVEKHRTERSEQQLLELAEHTNQVSFIFSSDWTELLFVNDAYEDIWGRSTETLTENPWDFLEGVYPDHRGRVQTEMQRLSAGESIETEYRVNADENYGRWVRVRGVPILDDTGDVVRVAGFASEITEKRERATPRTSPNSLGAHSSRVVSR
jgi:PAS domain S-box-containing protein